MDVIIIIIKTRSEGPSGKKLFIILFATAQALVPRTGKNTTQGSNQPLTAPLKPSCVPLSNSVEKVIPHANLGRQETPNKLGRSTVYTLILQNPSDELPELGYVNTEGC